VIQQLREAFPYGSAPRYLIFDRGSNFNEEVVSAIKSFGIEPKRTSFHKVRGRMALQNVLWEVTAVIFSTMSLCSMNAI
jgi:hypothetical protein